MFKKFEVTNQHHQKRLHFKVRHFQIMMVPNMLNLYVIRKTPNLVTAVDSFR